MTSVTGKDSIGYRVDRCYCTTQQQQQPACIPAACRRDTGVKSLVRSIHQYTDRPGWLSAI